MENIKFLKGIREYLKKENEYWKAEDLKYYVPTDYICDILEEYEVGIPKNIYEEILGGDKGYNTYFGMNYANYLKGNCVEDFKGDNSYNHDYMVQNDFEWETFKMNNGKYLVVLSFHIKGDIRGNYTNEIVLEFDYATQFYEVLNEIAGEYNLYFNLKVDDRIYRIAPTISEVLNVYDLETDEDINGIYGCSDEEVIENIRRVVNENK